MDSPLLRLLLCSLGPGLLVACTQESEPAPTRESRSSRYARDATPAPEGRNVSLRPEGSRAADVPGPSSIDRPVEVARPSTPADRLGPPETEDAAILEAAALRRSDWSPFGTRAQAIRCQAAVGEAALFFTPSWYAYDDQANPDTPIRGCERGESESILEAMPRGVGRTALCAIGWRAVVRPGTPFPYAGLGVRTAGNLDGVKVIQIETRSTGKPFAVTAQLHLEDQEFLPCGDARKAPHEQRLTCDGSGEWILQRLPIAGFKPSYGAPDSLDLGRVASLHFQNAPGVDGSLACDFRIAGVE